MKDPLYPLTWVTAHKSGNKNCSNHKKRARANTSWQFVENVDPPVLERKHWQFTITGLWGGKMRFHWESSKSEPDLNLRVTVSSHVSCKPITGLHTPTEGEGVGIKGPPTCQVPLQRGRWAVVPAVAAEGQEPDEEGSQYQT